MKTDEIEALERNVAIAVKNSKLFASKRPAELIQPRVVSTPRLISNLEPPHSSGPRVWVGKQITADSEGSGQLLTHEGLLRSAEAERA